MVKGVCSNRRYVKKGGALCEPYVVPVPHISDPKALVEECAASLAESPEKKTTKVKKEMPPKKVDIIRKRKRVMQLIDDPVAQDKLKK